MSFAKSAGCGRQTPGDTQRSRTLPLALYVLKKKPTTSASPSSRFSDAGCPCGSRSRRRLSSGSGCVRSSGGTGSLDVLARSADLDELESVRFIVAGGESVAEVDARGDVRGEGVVGAAEKETRLLGCGAAAVIAARRRPQRAARDRGWRGKRTRARTHERARHSEGADAKQRRTRAIGCADGNLIGVGTDDQ